MKPAESVVNLSQRWDANLQPKLGAMLTECCSFSQPFSPAIPLCRRNNETENLLPSGTIHNMRVWLCVRDDNAPQKLHHCLLFRLAGPTKLTAPQGSRAISPILSRILGPEIPPRLNARGAARRGIVWARPDSLTFCFISPAPRAGLTHRAENSAINFWAMESTAWPLMINTIQSEIFKV